MPQTSAMTYIRQGISPFFRLPTVDVHAGAPYKDLDAVVMGVPWDMSVTYRPGARFAPYEVRRVSALVQGFHPTHKLDVFGTLRAADGGNVAVPPFAPALARDVIENEVASVLGAGAVPFLVGGDHSIALPSLRAVVKKHGLIALVHVDAHLDTSDAQVWGEEFHHGAPIRHAIQEGLIERGQLHQVGIRAAWGHPEEGALAAAHGATLYDVDAIANRGIARVAQHIVSCVGDRPVYLTFDVDGVESRVRPRDRHARPRRPVVARGHRAATGARRRAPRGHGRRRGLPGARPRRHHGPPGRGRHVRGAGARGATPAPRAIVNIEAGVFVAIA